MSRKPQPYTCGVDAAIDVISGKWKAYIMWRMADGPKRFGELMRLVPGITEKMLIQHLRELEADRIVHREAFPEVPPKVVYSLTDIGHALNNALEPLAGWGHEHMDHIAAVRTPTATPLVEPGEPEGPARVDESRHDTAEHHIEGW